MKAAHTMARLLLCLRGFLALGIFAGGIFAAEASSAASPVRVSAAATLLPPDSAAGDRFGISAAVSGDGQIAVLGALEDDTPAGADTGSARSFVATPAGAWNVSTPLLAPDSAPGDLFGSAVALSADGETALVGALEDDTSDGIAAGSAWVFALSPGGDWVPTQQLFAPDATTIDSFGHSAALSADGLTAIIGAVGDDIAAKSNAGSAWVFTRAPGGAFAAAQKLVAPDGAAGDFFGSSVALSADGTSAVVAAFYDDTAGGLNAGSAYIFVRDPGGVWTPVQKLLAPDGATGDQLGQAAGLSAAGDRAVLGAVLDDTAAGIDAGSARIFDRAPDGSWSHTQTLLGPGGAPGDQFGASVAMTSAGDFVLVGAVNTDDAEKADAGSAHTYARGVGGAWSHVQTLWAPDAPAGAGLGESSALSADGDLALVGAANAAYVFDLADGDGAVVASKPLHVRHASPHAKRVKRLRSRQVDTFKLRLIQCAGQHNAPLDPWIVHDLKRRWVVAANVVEHMHAVQGD